MNGDVAASSEASERRARKPRPEIQIYRPGMLRKGDSTKSLTNEEKPPRPEKLTTSEVTTGSRRRSNDTDSVTSRGGSGSTTPDANAMNDRGKRRFGANSNSQQTSAYNSTQSLYDTRRQGGYTEYNGSRRGGNSGGGGGGRYQNQHRQPFERNGGNYSRGFNERASMRGDGAIAKRPSGGRRRNDSINSTQSEMPTSTNDQLHIDTTYDSVSQCGASSAYSMNSLGEAFSFEEMCQNLQSFKSMDWSKEVENEFLMQEEEEEMQQQQQQQMQNQMQNQNQQNGKLQEANGSSHHGRRHRNRRNRRNDESDRESSFGGSIAEEEEEDEELKSGERTPTSSRASIQPYNPRQIYQRIQKANNENRRHPKDSEVERPKKPERRGGYRGEHDDRDDDESKYDAVEHHMSSGRLAGRISIVKREVPVEEKSKGLRQKAPQSEELTQKPMQKRSFSPEMSNREALDRKRKAEIDRNEGPRLEQLKQNILKTLDSVKKRDLKAAEKVVKVSQELAELYTKVILADIFYAFSAKLETAMFTFAYHKVFDALRSASNSSAIEAKLIRGVASKFVSDGIAHYEQLIATYESTFNVSLDEDLTWPSGAPTEEQFIKEVVPLPYGMRKHADPKKKMALKSMSRLLLSLGDLQRYKALVDGSPNYEMAKSSYLKSSIIWPSFGHPYNQLGVVVYFAMLYRSGRRARLVPVDVLSRQRQERVIDELFYLCRAIACVYSYPQSKDRLTQRLEQARTKVAAYQPKIDNEFGSMTDDAKEHKMLLKAMKQVYIHPITSEFSSSSGEKLVDDLLMDIIRSPRAQLHRRAVAYMANTFGLLVTKIGMENFANETERALAFFYAALQKPETCFDSQQLTKLVAMFIYTVQINAKKNPSPSENEQLRLSISTLFTIYTILIEILLKQNLPKATAEYPRKALILLPAINVISTWMLHADTQTLLKSTPLETLPSTILTHLDPEVVFQKVRTAELARSEDLVETEEVTYPEYVILASFFSMFDPVPVKSRQHVAGSVVDGRILMMMEALKSLEKMTVRRCPSVEMNTKEEDEESPRDRKQLIVAERGKGSKALVVQPNYLVPDTNVFIGNLPIVKELLASKQFTILVPIRVKDELAALSKLPSPRTAAESEKHDPDRTPKAKQALEWLQKEFQQRNERLATLTSQGSKVNGLSNEIGDDQGDTNNDDVILSSAVKFANAFTPAANPQFQKAAEALLVGFDPSTVHRRTIVLLTGDRGLTIKSIDKNLPCQSIERFAEWFGTKTSD